jgi:Glycosyl hydrolases family 38 N-terminal domain/Glycosyl hydrolases family 38 C-terminal domain/Glycosyl hydrolases family 38 C-terminal beta sandwich domain
MRFPGSLILLTLLLPAVLTAQHNSAPNREIYVVPFSHLDLYWGGTQEECLSRGNRIITRAIQLAGQHPEFRFLLEDNVFVANFVNAMKGSPELDAFRGLVKDGRIELAPKWAGIYQNLPRGEAQVRNLVYGKRFARETFGVDPQVAHLGDLPGFTRQYPQILAKSATPYMVMTRMGPPDTSLFRWKSPDGSTALVWNAVKGYGWGVDLGLHRDLDDAHFQRVSSEIADIQATTTGPIYLGWGTDLWAPNERLIENIAVMNQRLAPARFRLATPTEYFSAASGTRPVPELAGEVPSSWANVITSISHIWPPTIAATDTLVNAEKFAAINHALGYAPYPQQQFDSLWVKALESMDHNNYGQGGEIGDERKVGYAQAAILQGGQILRESLRNIAERVRTPFPVSTPIVVFNPLSWTRDDVVKAHVTLYGDVQPSAIPGYRKAMRLIDETGASIPFHVTEYTENISRAVQLVFVARGVPSIGYKTYYLVPAEQADVFPNAAELKLDTDNDARNPRRVIGSHVLENAYYRVTVDRPVGRIDIFDKELGHVVAKDLEIAASEERGGNTLSVEPQTGRTIVNVVSSVEIEENNGVRTVVRIAGDIAGIPITQRLTLYQALKRIDLENSVDWKPGRFLKIEQWFPLQQSNPEVRTGVPFGSASEADLMPGAGPRFGDEVPRDIWKGWRQIQDWVSTGNTQWGVTISADHQFVTVAEGSVRAGMIRGTRFNPLNIVRDGRPVLLQQPPAGAYVYRYSFTSGKGDWGERKAWRSGMGFNTQLIPVSAVNELSRKTLPPENSFCSIEGDNLVISALKKSDRDSAIVLRVFNERGRAIETPVRLLGQDRGFRVANMLEETAAGGELKVLSIRPFEISTIRIPLP